MGIYAHTLQVPKHWPMFHLCNPLVVRFLCSACASEGRHLGFGLMEFGSTLDATRCLLQLNGIKVGSSNIRLGEALLPRKVVEPQQRQEQQTPEPQGQRRRQGRYIHPYPLPCE